MSEHTPGIDPMEGYDDRSDAERHEYHLEETISRLRSEIGERLLEIDSQHKRIAELEAEVKALREGHRMKNSDAAHYEEGWRRERDELRAALEDAETSLVAVAAHCVQPMMADDARRTLISVRNAIALAAGGGS